jgi:glycosyltransferase involved in cell wall biosynthesis
MRIVLAGLFIRKGGIQTHLKWLARLLEDEGIEVMAICLGNQDSKQSQRIDGSNIEIIHCHSSPLKRLIQITNIIKNFSPDIYMAVGRGGNLVLPPILSGVKIRNIFYEVMVTDSSGLSDSRWIVRWFYDEVVGQSPSIAAHFVKCFGWKGKTYVVPAIPEPLELIASLPNVIAKKVPFGKANAAMFCRLVPHKQAFWLVQQWDLLKEILDELHIYGTGAEESLIKAYINEKGIADRVKCFGRYSEGQDYVNLLSNYDMTLLPTLGPEGVPLVLLESMACGVPFVAYGVGGIPDYKNPNVLIVSPESNEFVLGIKSMALMLSNGDIDQEQLQKFYLQNYSYSVLKQKWLSYFIQ